MNITIYPRKLSGQICAIPSKSQAHRYLICSAFADSPTRIVCPETNQDIEATVQCLRALGADICRTNDGYQVNPISEIPNEAEIDCKESGSTLRFMLPICCALGIRTQIKMSGRLPLRPLSPLWEVLKSHGCYLSRTDDQTILVEGKLSPGVFSIAGNISSQFISGLLFASALMNGHSQIQIAGSLESTPYVKLTQLALFAFGIDTTNYSIIGHYPFSTPGHFRVEGDWSNAAFFLAAEAMGNPVKSTGLNPQSAQGDRQIQQILSLRESRPVIDVSDVPDLVPVLAVYFASKNGAEFVNIQRLRMKESDRVNAVCKMMCAFGIEAYANEAILYVSAGKFHSCTIDAMNDHRIAMAAAVAATVATGPVTILGADCVGKSYPSFWNEYQRLGGCYEQYIR